MTVLEMYATMTATATTHLMTLITAPTSVTPTKAMQTVMASVTLTTTKRLRGVTAQTCKSVVRKRAVSVPTARFVSDIDCVDGESCFDGNCQVDNRACTDDDGCADGFCNNDYQCVPTSCSNDADCPTVCDQGVCGECSATTPCPGNQECSGGQCLGHQPVVATQIVWGIGYAVQRLGVRIQLVWMRLLSPTISTRVQLHCLKASILLNYAQHQTTRHQSLEASLMRTGIISMLM